MLHTLFFKLKSQGEDTIYNFSYKKKKKKKKLCNNMCITYTALNLIT